MPFQPRSLMDPLGTLLLPGLLLNLGFSPHLIVFLLRSVYCMVMELLEPVTQPMGRGI